MQNQDILFGACTYSFNLRMQSDFVQAKLLKEGTEVGSASFLIAFAPKPPEVQKPEVQEQKPEVQEQKPDSPEVTAPSSPTASPVASQPSTPTRTHAKLQVRSTSLPRSPSSTVGHQCFYVLFVDHGQCLFYCSAKDVDGSC
jgi:hypothetical protein